MSDLSISISPEANPPLKGKALVVEIIEPEINKFNEWLLLPKNGRTTLTSMEQEILKAYLYQKIIGVL